MSSFLDRIPSQPPAPLGAYHAVVLRGTAGCVSGQFPVCEGRMLHPGRLGDPLDLRAGREAARMAALNVLAQIDKAVHGGLGAIELARVDGYIACAPGFDALPAVLDAASETFVEFLGKRGSHARGLIPVAHLPGRAAIELLVLFHLSPNPHQPAST
jgi:enamine deaminase RidA (YjgF/YER057c/UK114 family)